MSNAAERFAKTVAENTPDLSPQARLARLDARLGKGEGAVKERARLQALIDAQKPVDKKPKKVA